MKTSAKYIFLFSIIFILNRFINAQVPVQVQNTTNIYSTSFFKYNNTLFCIGRTTDFYSYLLKYNVTADSFELVMDSDNYKTMMFRKGDCIYEFNNKLFIKGAGWMYLMDQSFIPVKVKNCDSDTDNLFPHTLIGDTLFFGCGSEIWKTDFTIDGTKFETEIPGPYTFQLNSCGNILIIETGYDNDYDNYLYSLNLKKFENFNSIKLNHDTRIFNEAICFNNNFYFNCYGNGTDCNIDIAGISLNGLNYASQFTEVNKNIYYQSKDGVYSINNDTKNISKIINSNAAYNGVRPLGLLKYKDYLAFLSSLNGFTLYRYDVNNSTIDSFKILNNDYSYYSNLITKDNFIFFKNKNGIYSSDINNIENTKLILDPKQYNFTIADSSNMVIFNNVLFFNGTVSNKRSIYKLDLSSITKTENLVNQNSWQMSYDQKPNSDLKFNCDESSNEIVLEIFDLTGKFISMHHYKNTSSFQTDISDLMPGYYISVLTYDNQRKTFRFIKAF
ncbi:MAG TPA: T9SS type A sorting domain-containing protein [Saprospiraceae bacterium]|nr:T9SS type A sorting domain-containing protein [Saprospiraceae bacterium]